MDILYNLYGKISVGGWVIIDDWWMTGCQQAVIQFRRRHRIYDPISMIDNAAAYWIKSESSIIVNVSDWLEVKKKNAQNPSKKQGLVSLLFFGAINITSFLLSAILCCHKSNVTPFSISTI